MSQRDRQQRAESFDAFYLASRTRLAHQMYAMTGNLHDAQECVQEAYARAWQRWDQVSTYDDPEAWVRTVAWRVAASRWRKAKTRVATMARLGEPEPTPEPSVDNVVLVSALKQLPEEQRRAIVLHHLAGLSVEDVAHETGAPTGTVKARLSRGRTALAAIIGDVHDRDSAAAAAGVAKEDRHV
ncbi:MAG: SigE family RNA polymerase sigma factor [Actinomycetales bacterium]